MKKSCPLCNNELVSEINFGCIMCGMPLKKEEKFCSIKCKKIYMKIHKGE